MLSLKMKAEMGPHGACFGAFRALLLPALKVNEGQALFQSSILDKLDFKKFKSQFKPALSIKEAGNGLVVRPLQSSDYAKGFIELLSQLTSVGEVSVNDFNERFNSMKQCQNTYYITVIEDTTSSEVVGSASLVLEKKFIHGCALRGRVEDVVVSDQYRGKQLGKLLIATMVSLAEELGVYKLTLDCKDHMVPFYQSFGFNSESGNSNFMQMRFSN